jgi:hypothetical protein
MAFPPKKKENDGDWDDEKPKDSRPKKQEKSGAVPSAGLPEPGGPPTGRLDGSSFPAGPSGLPFGASIPGGEPQTSNSPLLQALMASLGGEADPYGVPPQEQGHVMDGVGLGDPQMGLEQLLATIAMAQAGVGGGQQGGPVPGGSGVDQFPSSLGAALM